VCKRVKERAKRRLIGWGADAHKLCMFSQIVGFEYL
jgi:hypothetical protein